MTCKWKLLKCTFKFQANLLAGFCKKGILKVQKVNFSSELAGPFPTEINLLLNFCTPNPKI